jgi:hypothetical protein
MCRARRLTQCVANRSSEADASLRSLLATTTFSALTYASFKTAAVPACRCL